LELSTSNYRAIAYFLGGITTIKLVVLLLIGPVIWPDTEAYISFADAILAHGPVFDHVGFAGGPAAPIFVFRLAGYPLVLATAKLISPQYYGQVTVFFQILLNIIAMVLMVRVLACLSFTMAQIVAAIGLYAFSDSLLFDNSLLSDSIYSSLFNIVIFALLGHLVAGSRLTLVGALALGLLWGFSTWTRDSGIYLTYLPIGLVTAIVVGAPGSILRRFGHLSAFIIVIFAMTGAYSGFNKYRTGEFFFSITGVENWLRPVFDIARYGNADPFDGDDLVSKTVREGMPDYEYPAQVVFIERLHQRCGCTPRQLQSLVFQKYLTTVTHYPIGYIQVVWRNFHFFLPGRTARRSDSDHQSIFRVRNISASQIRAWSFYSELARLAAAVFGGDLAPDASERFVYSSRYGFILPLSVWDPIHDGVRFAEARTDPAVARDHRFPVVCVRQRVDRIFAGALRGTSRPPGFSRRLHRYCLRHL